MTEQEWLACDRPHWMLKHLRPWKRRERKILLYICASYRCPGFSVPLEEPCRILLDVAERHADGLVGREEFTAAKLAVGAMTKQHQLAGGENRPPFLVGQALLNFVRLQHLPGWEGDSPAAERFDYLGEEARRNRAEMRSGGMDVITEAQAVEVQKEYDAFMAYHTTILRDLFGNPFRPVTVDPTWQTPAILQQAQAAYAERELPGGHLDPARLATLADALEKAGCDNANILAHLRSLGPHVRGCWAVDLVLGKT